MCVVNKYDKYKSIAHKSDTKNNNKNRVGKSDEEK